MTASEAGALARTGNIPLVDAPGPSGGTRGRVLALGAGAVFLASLVVMFLPVPREVVGFCAVLATLVLIFMRMSIGLALILPSLVGLVAVSGPLALENVLLNGPYGSIAEWTLSVVPMFVLMGLLLWKSGITESLYDAGKQWLSWLPGGLAVGTTAAGTGLSAISGSTAGTTYALARIGIPEMLKAGYHKRLAVGSVIVAGLPGQLIPPSILLVLYAGISETPIGPQLLAGVVPGLLIGLMSAVMLVGLSVVWPALAGRGSSVASVHTSWSARFSTAAAVWPLPILVLIVVGGMFSGVFTATEAGAAGALGALVLTLWKKRGRHPLRAVGEAAIGTVSAVGAIFLLLVGADILTRLLAVTRVADLFTEWVISAGLGTTSFLLLMLIVYLVLGMFLEPLAMLLLTVPLLLPTLVALDVSLVWFGVFAVFMGELAVVTPPVGIIAFLLAGLVKEPAVNQGQRITLGDVFTATAWFLPMCIFFALALIAFPEIATWLPSMGGFE